MPYFAGHCKVLETADLVAFFQSLLSLRESGLRCLLALNANSELLAKEALPRNSCGY